MTDTPNADWGPLRPKLAPALRAARIVAHWAAQIPAAAGTTLSPARDDFSHTALDWDTSTRALVGASLTPIEDIRVALRVSDLSLLLLQDGAPSQRIPLQGLSVRDALGRLGAALSGAFGEDVGPLSRPEHDLPDHPVGGSEVFNRAGLEDGLTELEQWFSNAAQVLGRLTLGFGTASPVRCWPHHFDIATLVTLGGEGENAQSIGIGMSPGDGSCDEPYWYVSPWPYPDPPPTAALPAGHWHTDGFVAAVYPGSAMAEASAEKQETDTTEFLVAAASACRELLMR